MPIAIKNRWVGRKIYTSTIAERTKILKLIMETK